MAEDNSVLYYTWSTKSPIRENRLLRRSISSSLRKRGFGGDGLFNRGDFHYRELSVKIGISRRVEKGYLGTNINVCLIIPEGPKDLSWLCVLAEDAINFIGDEIKSSPHTTIESQRRFHDYRTLEGKLS